MNQLQENILAILNETLPDIIDVGFMFSLENHVIQICKPLHYNNKTLIATFNWNTIKDKILFLIDILEANSHIVNRIELCMGDGSDVQFSKRNKRLIRDVKYPVKYLNFTDIYTFGDNQEPEIDIIWIFLN